MPAEQPYHTIDETIASLKPIAEQAHGALSAALASIDKEKAPQLYTIVQKLSAVYDRATGHYEQISAVAHKALGTTSPEQVDRLEGEYDALKKRLAWNQVQAETLLGNLSLLVTTHPEIKNVKDLYDNATHLYEPIKQFYGLLRTNATKLDPVAAKGFSELTPTEHWYDDVPVLNDIMKSSTGKLIRYAIGIAIVAIGYYLWEKYRKQNEEEGKALPRLKRSSQPTDSAGKQGPQNPMV